MVLSRCGPDVLYVFDTFMDVDRGYYPRDAFIDRRFNPRPPARVFTALASLFPGDDRFTLLDGGSDDVMDFEHAGGRCRLACARRDSAIAALGGLDTDDGVHDLLTGRETTVPELRAGTGCEPDRPTRTGRSFCWRGAADSEPVLHRHRHALSAKAGPAPPTRAIDDQSPRPARKSTTSFNQIGS